MSPTLQTIFRENFETFAPSRCLPPPLHKAARALMQCRTAELGGHVQKCPDGHVERIGYNSCKHRCGPQCAEIHRERWLHRTKDRLLDCAHYHVIFTIPHELHEVWLLNPAVLPSLLFRSVRDTLIGLLADPRYLGALPGFLSSLHTWGQTLILHPHLHCLVTAGGWTQEGLWRDVTKGYLLPVKVVQAVYRGKVLDAIRTALDRGELHLPAPQSVTQLHSLLNKLGRKKWNVRIQARYDHGQGVAIYLARYVRGGPMSNRRLLAADEAQVTFRYHDYRDGQDKPMTLPTPQFLQRLLWHVPEPGAHWVRSYGLYSPAKRDVLTPCRQHLGQAPIEPAEYLDWQTYCQDLGQVASTQCPVCGKRLVCTQAFPPGGVPPPTTGSSVCGGRLKWVYYPQAGSEERGTFVEKVRFLHRPCHRCDRRSKSDDGARRGRVD